MVDLVFDAAHRRQIPRVVAHSRDTTYEPTTRIHHFPLDQHIASYRFEERDRLLNCDGSTRQQSLESLAMSPKDRSALRLPGPVQQVRLKEPLALG